MLNAYGWKIIPKASQSLLSRIGIKNSRILHFGAVKPETGVKLKNDLILFWGPEWWESKTYYFSSLLGIEIIFLTKKATQSIQVYCKFILMETILWFQITANNLEQHFGTWCKQYSRKIFMKITTSTLFWPCAF